MLRRPVESTLPALIGVQDWFVIVTQLGQRFLEHVTNELKRWPLGGFESDDLAVVQIQDG
ncbi:hypothetical protein D3C86_2122250 [compost metagenome]